MEMFCCDKAYSAIFMQSTNYLCLHFLVFVTPTWIDFKLSLQQNVVCKKLGF